MDNWGDVIYLVQNDYGEDIFLRITDVEGNPIPLTGALEVRVFVYEVSRTNSKINRECTIYDASEGIVKFTTQPGDFDEAEKTYYVELQVTFQGKIITAPSKKEERPRIVVRREAPP